MVDVEKLSKVLIFAGIVIGLIGVVLERDQVVYQLDSVGILKSERFDQGEVEEIAEKVVVKERKKGGVMRVVWKDMNYPLHEFLKSINEPVIIENAPHVSVWKAYENWDWKYLKESLVKTDNVYVHTNRVFGPYWNPEKPMSKLSTVIPKNMHKLANISAIELFDKIVSTNDNEFHYFTTNIKNIEPILEDILPLHLIDLDPTSSVQNINVWFGKKGVIAALHYDDYGNLNTQIKGKKKWTLYSPAEHEKLFLYPFLHPHQAQSQVNLQKVLHFHANFLNAHPLVVETNVGETLYLPPLWFHQVEALETSINVNSWSFYPESATMAEIIKLIPVSMKSDPKSRTHELAFFLQQLFKEMELPPTWIWKNLIKPRFQPLIKQKIFEDEDFYADFIDPTFTINTKPHLSQMAKKVSQKFKAIPSSTKDIWLANYIEIISYYTVSGNTALIPALLKSISKNAK